MNSDEQIQWVRGLHEISQSIASEKASTVQQRLLDYVVEGFDAVSGSIALLEDKERLILIAGSGSAAAFVGTSIAIDKSILGWVVQQEEPLLLTGDISNDERFKHLAQRSSNNRPGSSMCWPLITNQKVIGVMSINRSHEQAAFTETGFNRGDMVGLISLVVDNLRLYEAQQGRITSLYELNQELADKQAKLERINAEKIASEVRLKTVLDIAPEAIIVADSHQRITDFNQGAETIFEYAADEVIGLPLERLMPERFADSHSDHVKEFEQAADNRKKMITRAGILARRKDGSEFPAGVSISKTLQDGRPLFTAVLRDLTQEKAVEQALHDSEERLRFSQEFSKIGSWDRNIQTGQLCWSDGIWSMFGYDKKKLETSSEDYFKAIHPDDRDSVAQAVKNCIEKGADYDIEYRVLWPNGTLHWLQERGDALRDDQGLALRMLGIVQDTTDRKESEAELAHTIERLKTTNHQLKDAQNQLLQSEKMASIGQLAAGVAHEINNPVGYINSNLGSLRQYIENLFKLLEAYEQAEEYITADDPKQVLESIKVEVDVVYLKQDLKELLSESAEGVTRVKQIVQDLKDFSHVDEAEWQWADLQQGIDSTLNIVSNEIKYKAEVIKEYSDLPQIECIVSQLNQVFMNLLVNAAHAIEDRGTITVSTGTEAEGVWVTIEDTGKGMDAETRNKIFDPFFTTKPVGKGTGLGLSLSYSIIQKHKGTINVESEIDRGTKFCIWLPIVQEKQRVAG